MTLNTEQQAAVLHKEGPAMVLAGPGSGKTRVITERILTLTQSYHIPSSKILTVTFTRAAAREMQQRYEAEAGDAAVFGTFHSIFYQILRSSVQLDPQAVVTAAQQSDWLRELLFQYAPDWADDAELLPSVLREIARVKSFRLDTAEYEAKSCEPQLFRLLYEGYAERLKKERKIDFEDMQLRTLALFRSRPKVLAAWQKRWSWVMVDEFQDINPLQYELIGLLAAPENNLFIVGDDDQAIYGFRGADPALMQRFVKDHPGAAVFRLRGAYRCSPQILAAASRVIARNTSRFRKDLTALAPSGPEPEIAAYESTAAQARAVTARILRLTESGMPPENIAILCRTAYREQPFLHALLQENIPFRVRDRAPDIYEHRSVRDVMTYLRLGAGSRRRADLLPVMNRPKRFWSRESIPGETFDLAEAAAFYRGHPRMEKMIAAFARDLEVLSRLRPFAAVEYVRRQMGYDEFLKNEAAGRMGGAGEALDRLDLIQEESAEFATLREWEESIRARQARLRERKEDPRGVTVSTIHGAKGLEYDAVFLPDLSEGILPHSRALSEDREEEERRMFYVALTRARRLAFLSWTSGSRGEKGQPSRFLREMSRNAMPR